jgi:levanase
VEIGYDYHDKVLFLDRRHAGDVNFHPEFAKIDNKALDLNGKLKLKIFLDEYILEVFNEDGSVSICDLTFLTGKVNVNTIGDKLAVKVNAWKIR